MKEPKSFRGTEETTSTQRPGLTACLPTVVILLVSGSVLAFQAGGLFRFVWIKLLILTIAVALGLLSKGRVWWPRSLVILLWLLAISLFTAVLAADYPLASLTGRWPRYEGLLTICLYIGLFLTGSKVLGGSDDPRPWANLRSSLAVVALVLLGIIGLESLGFRPLGGEADVRPGATLGNATDLGLVGFIVAGLLSVPLPYEHRWQLQLRWAGFFAGAAVAVLSGSRAALLGLLMIIGVRVLLWNRKRSYSLPKSIGVTVLVGAVFALAVLIVPAIRLRLLSGETVQGRLLLWDRSLSLIKEHALTGVGPSGFVDKLPTYLDENWIRSVGEAYPADSPHSWPLQILAAGGFPLLVLVVAACGTSLFFICRQIRTAEAGAYRTFWVMTTTTALAYGVALLTHFTAVGTTALVAFICGGLLTHCRPKPLPVIRHGNVSVDRQERTRVTQLLTAGGIAMALASLVISIPATAAEWPMNAGAKAAKAGRSAQADAHFATAYGLRPWDADTALLAAQAFAGPATAGDSQAAKYAVKWAGLARNGAPRSQEAGLALAIGHIYSGDPETGKSVLNSLLQTAPYSPSLYIQRGVANFSLGQITASLEDLHRAAAIDPASPTPWEILARIHERLGDFEAARSAQARAQSLS